MDDDPTAERPGDRDRIPPNLDRLIFQHVAQAAQRAARVTREDPTVACTEFEAELGAAANEAYRRAAGEECDENYLADQDSALRQVLITTAEQCVELGILQATFREGVEEKAALRFRDAYYVLHECPLPGEIVSDHTYRNGVQEVAFIRRDDRYMIGSVIRLPPVTVLIIQPP